MEGTPENGTGYYLFHKNPQGCTFHGAFLRRPGQSYRLVYGIKIEDDADCNALMPNFIRQANAAAEQEQAALDQPAAAGQPPPNAAPSTS